MRSDKERVWNYLSWNPGKFARTSGDCLQQLSQNKKPWWKTKLHREFDRYTIVLIDNAVKEIEIIAVMHYWVSVCDLPIELGRTVAFDAVHTKCNELIFKMIEDLGYKNFTKDLGEILK